MGGILRLLIIAAIIYLVYVWVRKQLNKSSSNEINPPPEQQLMRQCAYCQVHIPEGECTQSQGHYFCNEQHRDLYLQQQK